MGNAGWYRAHIRWTAIAGDEQCFKHSEHSVHIFLSEDETAAMARAMEIANRGQHCRYEGRRWIETKLAEVLELKSLGADEPKFDVLLGLARPYDQNLLNALPFQSMSSEAAR